MGKYKKRNVLTYLTQPQIEKKKAQGFRPVKEYETYWLFEKVVNDVPLYRECFHKFELYGAAYANAPAEYAGTHMGWRKGEPNWRKRGH